MFTAIGRKVSLLFLCFSLSVFFPLTAQEINRSFDVKPGGTLDIESDVGSIEVTSGKSDKVEINVSGRGWNNRDEDGENLKDFTVDFSQDGNTVYVYGRYDHDRDRGWNRIKVRFTITVPQKFNLDMETSGGSIEVEDLEGEVDVRTAGGSLSFGNISGPVMGRTAGGSIELRGSIGKADLRTAGGSISIGDVDGDIDANTAGGSIRIDRARGNIIAHTSGGSIDVDEVMGSIEASTSGGSVHARITKQPSADCRLETSGGDIKVYLPNDVNLDLDAKSYSGRISFDFEVKGEINKKSIRGKIGDGGPKLYLRNSSGRIYIRKV